MTTAVAPVVPIRHCGLPVDVTELENCANTESLSYALACARPRIHRRYGTFATALNVTSTEFAGFEAAVVTLAAPAFGFAISRPPAADASACTLHAPAV